VWIFELRDQSFGYWKLTEADGAGLRASDFVRPETFRYMSLNGLKIPFFQFIPKNGETPRNGWPCVIWIHGGPEAQFRPSFNPIIQFLLAAGFAVVAPNVRGSTGYGRKFSALDDVEKRMDSVTDIKYLAEHLRTEKRINSQKLALYGASYGGFVVLAAMTEYPDLFHAAIDIVGISNFVTFLQNTAPWRRHLREKEYGSLTVDRELLARISPLNKIQNSVVKTPTLLVHGVNDERVPLSEAEQIYNELKRKGISTELISFADEGHGIVKLSNKKRLYPAILSFLRQHLTGE
jgi:dipeptidyl aminopeptidase/acylaminoacyl peptidase